MATPGVGAADATPEPPVGDGERARGGVVEPRRARSPERRGRLLSAEDASGEPSEFTVDRGRLRRTARTTVDRGRLPEAGGTSGKTPGFAVNRGRLPEAGGTSGKTPGFTVDRGRLPEAGGTSGKTPGLAAEGCRLRKPPPPLGGRRGFLAAAGIYPGPSPLAERRRRLPEAGGAPGVPPGPAVGRGRLREPCAISSRRTALPPARALAREAQGKDASTGAVHGLRENGAGRGTVTPVFSRA
jgi:hypothetical protein